MGRGHSLHHSSVCSHLVRDGRDGSDGDYGDGAAKVAFQSRLSTMTFPLSQAFLLLCFSRTRLAEIGLIDEQCPLCAAAVLQRACDFRGL